MGLLHGLTCAVGGVDSGAMDVDLEVIALPLYLDFRSYSAKLALFRDSSRIARLLWGYLLILSHGVARTVRAGHSGTENARIPPVEGAFSAPLHVKSHEFEHFGRFQPNSAPPVGVHFDINAWRCLHGARWPFRHRKREGTARGGRVWCHPAREIARI